MNKLAGKVVTKVLETEPKPKLFIHFRRSKAFHTKVCYVLGLS